MFLFQFRIKGGELQSLAEQKRRVSSPWLFFLLFCFYNFYVKQYSFQKGIKNVSTYSGRPVYYTSQRQLNPSPVSFIEAWSTSEDNCIFALLTRIPFRNRAGGIESPGKIWETQFQICVMQADSVRKGTNRTSPSSTQIQPRRRTTCYLGALRSLWKEQSSVVFW